VSQTSELLEAYLVVNFKVSKISRGARKLTRTPTVIKKKNFPRATTSLDQSVCFISRNFILRYKHYDIVGWYLALYILIKSF
jgi:hypothetical protein